MEEERPSPRPMAIGHEMNGYRTRDGWPLGCDTDGHPTKVRWPSVPRAFGQVYASDSQFGCVDGAIFTNMEGENQYVFNLFMQK